WIEGAIDVDEQHGGSGTELKAPSRKCHLAGKRFGSQLRTVAGGELPNDPNFVAFGGETIGQGRSRSCRCIGRLCPRQLSPSVFAQRRASDFETNSRTLGGGGGQVVN